MSVNKVTFIGDVHGKWEHLLDILEPRNQYIQVGDFGIGFGINIPVEDLPSDFYFIRGNHDNEAECKDYPQYLGKYGYNQDLNVFYISGAYSVDKARRIEGVSWWADEELSWEEANQCIELYKKIKPTIVVSHDCPIEHRLLCLPWVSTTSNYSSNTVKLLTELMQIHQPAYWIHGHLHISKKTKIGNTQFIGLDELETFTLELPVALKDKQDDITKFKPAWLNY